MQGNRMNSPETRPRIAYLTNLYPSVSHTFIRREIAGLEAMGYEITRCSIRGGGHFVDPADIEDNTKTFHVLSRPKGELLLRVVRALFRAPLAVLSALPAAMAMSRRSDRGLARHLAYWVEALILLDYLAPKKIAHLHVHFGTNAAAAARLLRRMGGPGYSMTIHGPDEFDAPVGLSLADKMADARFTVAITDFCASQLQRWTPLPEWKKIHNVHCTVPANWFDAAQPIPEDADSLVCIGRLSAQKGQLLLLEAFKRVVDAGAPGRLVLVGDGEMRADIERQIDALDLRARVVVAGWQDEAQVRGHLLRARALVMASFAEGLPMVIMEAMALQRPVVVTQIAGIPELVRPGEDGWCVPAGSREQLAEAMIACLQAPIAALNAMGARAAVRVRARHSVATEVAKLDTLFRDYVGDPA